MKAKYMYENIMRICTGLFLACVFKKAMRKTAMIYTSYNDIYSSGQLNGRKLYSLDSL